MAKKDFYVDIDLLGNQIKNFAIEKIDNLNAIENLPAFDGRTVYNKDDGHLYVYSVNPEDPSSGSWKIQARYEDIEKAIMEDPSILEHNPVIKSKLDKIDEPGKVYGTDYERDPETGEIIIDPETGEPVVIQTSYDVDSFGKVEDVQVNGTSVVTNKIANITLGTMAGESKDDYVQTLIDNGVNGKSYVWNESNGSGIRYEKGDSKVFVAVRSDENNGEFVSIGAENGDPENNKKLIINSNGIYYVKGDSEISENDELVSTSDLNEVRDELQAQIEESILPERKPETNGQFLTNDGTNAFWGDLPEYTITKDEQAEQGYAHTYHLQKDGVNVGASINIPSVGDMSLNDLTNVELINVEDDQILVFSQNENENEGKWINKNRQSAIIRNWI